MATSVWRAMAGNPVRFVLSRWPWRSLAYVVSSVAVISIAWLAVMPLLLFPPLLLLVGIPIGALERHRLGFMEPLAVRGYLSRRPLASQSAADQGLNGFTIWPAQSPRASDYSRDQRGTEFFLSSNAAEEATGTDEYVSNSIVTWSLTNTKSLDSASPNVQLNDTRVGVRTYSLPPPANQKAGPIPLGECLNDVPCATFLHGAPDPFAPEVESTLDSNDARMQQVTYAGGKPDDLARTTWLYEQTSQLDKEVLDHDVPTLRLVATSLLHPNGFPQSSWLFWRRLMRR